MARALSGISQGICREMAPLERFSACSSPISSIFSSRLRGSPPPGKRPKRVPPVPNAQLGIATSNSISFRITYSDLFSVSITNSSLRRCPANKDSLCASIVWFSICIAILLRQMEYLHQRYHHRRPVRVRVHQIFHVLPPQPHHRLHSEAIQLSGIIDLQDGE